MFVAYCISRFAIVGFVRPRPIAYGLDVQRDQVSGGTSPVTNVRAFFSSLWRRAIAPGFAVAGLGLLLAGCETGGSALNGATSPTASVVPAQQGRAKLAFAPIVGAPATVADQLSSGLTSALSAQSIPVSKTGGEGVDYTVRGYVVAAPDKTGTKLSYIWDVTDKTGQRAQRFTGEEVVKATKKSKDPWAPVDQAVIERIVSNSASQIAGWVPMKAGTPVAAAQPETQTSDAGGFGSTALGKLFGFGTPEAAPANAAPAQTAAITPPAVKGNTPGALVTGEGKVPQTTASLPAAMGLGATNVATVSGAPGDGAQSLTRALLGALRARGVNADAGATGGYTVQGKVVMGQPSGGKQTIKIEWVVLDAAGKKKGTVWQNNVIPQGALDGPWGKTADDAAAEAAKGIAELLPKQA